jgi:hypothetical protein
MRESIEAAVGRRALAGFDALQDYLGTIRVRQPFFASVSCFCVLPRWLSFFLSFSLLPRQESTPRSPKGQIGNC